MAEVFADTGYWIAITIHTDALHEIASDLTSRLRSHRIVTTEAVLVEVLDHASKLGPYWRRLTANLVQNTMRDPQIEVLPKPPIFLRRLSPCTRHVLISVGD